MNVGLLLLGLITSLRSAGRILYAYAEKTCLATVHVKDEDQLYEDIILWMNDHVFKDCNFRSVLAQTTSSEKKEHKEKKREKGMRPDKRPKPDKLINYKQNDDGSSMELKPFHGSRFFRFKGTWILFNHAHEPITSTQQVEGNPPMKLQCLSLSLSPIVALLEEARAYRRQVSVSSITVHRAMTTPREMIRWKPVASRSSRDISTVILKKDKKEAILQDINEYLHPHTQQWYANHGIPYRRGYLFSGPPGTGKTSLASAIAGVFGLDIYVLSLLDPTITESHFIRLFSEVPTRCVVLLEDIDAAGLNRGSLSSKESKSADGQNTTTNGNTVSLSGLLNAIDGVSSQEGRILIMTTNAPQDLDKALIRPGRVDMHVQFDLPSHEELHSLFLSMYSDVPEIAEAKEKPESLDELATRFAESVPEKQHSLAEVQGFLLRFKRDPKEACSNVTGWVEEMQEELK
ncbi:hypothetical protein ASPWEDRAFT_45633 [Aspergillus wentii DTO 134E9]|uniref:AAA+ ATPase domain-containing protein n=1 Tax=Aspergillus wentii DTO 134E9 TaxID=1073089 RepID=A0A1L9R9R7_ASPWE|nr:uncharacterized protein ASPWEDRAFT_45633 [Aspergillus wentii DTO 134E9]OJJ31666.1 hypothetical protein ASPWEDRAFT_45633 [Aspergillus wentii DTO 134E9]